MSWTKLNSKEDFEWYKQSLDVARKYRHRHCGETSTFPCYVESEWRDDPNGPYEYHHKFEHDQLVACDACGVKKMVTPKRVTEDMA